MSHILSYQAGRRAGRPSMWLASALEIEGGILFTLGCFWLVVRLMILSILEGASPWQFFAGLFIGAIPATLGAGLLISGMMLRDEWRWAAPVGVVCLLLTVMLPLIPLAADLWRTPPAFVFDELPRVVLAMPPVLLQLLLAAALIHHVFATRRQNRRIAGLVSASRR